jgi:hypothetical protein
LCCAATKDAHARKVLLKGDSHLHGITGLGFGYQGLSVKHSGIEYYDTQDTTSAIDFSVHSQPEPVSHSTAGTDNALPQIASGLDRRTLLQDMRLEGAAVVQVNQATHTTIASSLIGRAAGGHMDISSAIRNRGSPRNSNSLSVLEFIDGQWSGKH